MTTRQRFDAAPILAGLKEFQLDTVAHVMSRFHGPDPTRRILVSDETGLGKSIVARGVIARTIEQLQDDPSVDRIDIVYVCSNADLARQNLARLNVTGAPGHAFASRLTLLGAESHVLREDDGRWLKPIKLVSFTPGTSFSQGSSNGTARERALLFLLLKDPLALTRARKTAALRLLQGRVFTYQVFEDEVNWLRANLRDGIDPAIAARFLAGVATPSASGDSMLDEFDQLLIATVGRSKLSEQASAEVRNLTGRLRAELARAGIETLQPDLVILDEFQRFRDVLDEDSEVGELAHALFNHQQARVLLLSATPFKPYTLAEEGKTGDSHRAGFRETIGFLARGCSSANLDAIEEGLDDFRLAAVAGRNATELVRGLRSDLLQLMCRAERPDVDGGRRTVERVVAAEPVQTAELVGYAQLRKLAQFVDGQLSVDYWKSAPYFINFMEGYQLRNKVDIGRKDPARAEEVGKLLRNTHYVSRATVEAFGEVDLGNARLRRLAGETIGAGWERLLWVPPTLPYFEPQAPFDAAAVQGMTKRLIFSSWAAAPTAIASLLSYQAERLIAGPRGPDLGNTPEGRRRVGPRLTYRLEGSRPAAMTTLSLFWPMPGLASRSDPLAAASRSQGPADPDDAVHALAAELRTDLPTDGISSGGTAESWFWAAAFSAPGSVPFELPSGEQRSRIASALAGQADSEGEETDDPRGIAAHIQLAFDHPAPDSRQPRSLPRVLAELAIFSPANSAWRALGRLFAPGQVSEAGHWYAAAALASGLRSLFNRWEAVLLLDQLYPDPDLPYWRAVLQYCAAGNLQAMLDEYLFHLADAEGLSDLDDEKLFLLAQRAASAMSLRTATYTGFNPADPDSPIRFSARFALRYGSSRKSDESTARLGEVRQAFNSPFWPFVLASTSVGQEGIDFHWWCHSLVHWNVPSNPVDFEQREGRVDRFRGHAIRRNIAAEHGKQVLACAGKSPWATAYQLAAEGVDRVGGLVPDWIQPGPFAVERTLLPYPMSVDSERLRRIKSDLALYRLTFGQNRQEDLVELLRLRGVGDRPEEVRALRLDLRAPGMTEHG